MLGDTQFHLAGTGNLARSAWGVPYTTFMLSAHTTDVVAFLQFMTLAECCFDQM